MTPIRAAAKPLMVSTAPLAPPPSAPPSPSTARDAHRDTAARQFAQVSRVVGFVLTAVVLAAALRTFVLEPINIPSDSMLPTLEAGDYLVVAKWPYGFGRYSPPVSLPWPDGRIGGHPPRRGDVVVFKTPRDNRTDFIKRIVGLPGDRIRFVGGQIELNGVLVPKIRAGDYVVAAAGGTCRATCRYPRFVETIDGRSYAVLDQFANDAYDDTPLVTVPAGHYFVAGDNRDDSADSRLSLADGGVGMVPAANLVGRAEAIVLAAHGGSRRLDGARP